MLRPGSESPLRRWAYRGYSDCVLRLKTTLPSLLLLGCASLLVIAIARAGVGSAFSAGFGYRETIVWGNEFPKALVSGRTKTILEHSPQRIASLTVTADEILTALVAPSRIAALTRFADDPTVATCAGRASKTAARIRGADPEKLIAHEPDLVFVAHYTLDSATRIIRAAGIPVVRLRETRSFDDVAANVRTIAAATGEEARGSEAIAAMRSRLDQIRDRVSGRRAPRVLYYSAIGYTAGAATLVDTKIRLAGGRNVAADAGLSGFRSVSLDLLVALNPEVILVPRWTSDAQSPVRDVTDSPAFRDVIAVQTHRVHALAASSLTSESPDSVIGVEEVARLLHPEAFQ